MSNWTELIIVIFSDPDDRPASQISLTQSTQATQSDNNDLFSEEGTGENIELELELSESEDERRDEENHEDSDNDDQVEGANNDKNLLDEETEEEQPQLGYVLKREGQRGKSGTGVIFSHINIDFHRKTTKRTKDGSFYLVCKTRGCPAKLIVAEDERTVKKVYGGEHLAHDANLMEN